MKTAKLIMNIKGWRGDARLYKLSEPVEYNAEEKKTKFVIVSAVHTSFSGSETYIFPANKDGAVTDWGELEGSFRGGLDHVVALENAGFTVIK
jgi:hypothetical protein